MSGDRNHSTQFRIQVASGIVAGLAVAAIVALATNFLGLGSARPEVAALAGPATTNSDNSAVTEENLVADAPAQANVLANAPVEPIVMPAPPPNRAQQASSIIADYWALREEGCRFARQVVISGDAIEIRMGGRPVGPALALRSVSGNTVFAEGPGGPVQFSVVGDEMTYQGHVLRRCR